MWQHGKSIRHWRLPEKKKKRKITGLAGQKECNRIAATDSPASYSHHWLLFQDNITVKLTGMLKQTEQYIENIGSTLFYSPVPMYLL